MFLVSSCSCLCAIYRSQMLSREWRCSWNSADRRCSNYIWVINNFIAYKGIITLEVWRYIKCWQQSQYPITHMWRQDTGVISCKYKVGPMHYLCQAVCNVILTHWGRDKIDAISQTTFSNAFSWMKMNEFRLGFHWSLFPRFESTIFHQWFR